MRKSQVQWDKTISRAINSNRTTKREYQKEIEQIAIKNKTAEKEPQKEKEGGREGRYYTAHSKIRGRRLNYLAFCPMFCCICNKVQKRGARELWWHQIRKVVSAEGTFSVSVYQSALSCNLFHHTWVVFIIPVWFVWTVNNSFGDHESGQWS